MSTQERFIKHTFDVSVPAYFFATTSPGTPIPIKRYVSSPIVNFEVGIEPSTLSSSENASKYVIGSDDPTLPLDNKKIDRNDQRNIGGNGEGTRRKLFPVHPLESSISSEDPALSVSSRSSIVREVNKSPTGETVYSGASLGELEISYL